MRSRWGAGGDSCTRKGQNCGDTETEAWAGNGKTSASGVPRGKENPSSTMGNRDADRNQVGKHAKEPSRKATIVPSLPVPETDTGGRGENPKAGGRSVVKELGKMAP